MNLHVFPSAFVNTLASAPVSACGKGKALIGVIRSTDTESKLPQVYVKRLSGDDGSKHFSTTEAILFPSLHGLLVTLSLL